MWQYLRTNVILLLLCLPLCWLCQPGTAQAQYQISNEQLTQQEQICDQLLLKLTNLKLSTQTSSSDLTEASNLLTVSRQEIASLKTELQLSKSETIQTEQRLMNVSNLLKSCESKIDKLEKQIKAEKISRQIERAGWIVLTAYLLFK